MSTRSAIRPQPAPNPSTPAEIAAYLDDLSRRMFICGSAMAYYGGFAPMAEHGLQLVAQARVVKRWACGIQEP